MLVDIEVNPLEMMVLLHRADGNCTVSVSVGAFQRAAKLLYQQNVADVSSFVANAGQIAEGVQ